MLTGSDGKHMFRVLGNCQTVFQSAVLFCIPASSEREFLLLHILTSICVVSVMAFPVLVSWPSQIISISRRCIVVSRCFNLQSPNDI